jgi:hypothetical protein
LMPATPMATAADVENFRTVLWHFLISSKKRVR